MEALERKPTKNLWCNTQCFDCSVYTRKNLDFFFKSNLTLSRFAKITIEKLYIKKIEERNVTHLIMKIIFTFVSFTSGSRTYFGKLLTSSPSIIALFACFFLTFGGIGSSRPVSMISSSILLEVAKSFPSSNLTDECSCTVTSNPAKIINQVA